MGCIGGMDHWPWAIGCIVVMGFIGNIGGIGAMGCIGGMDDMHH